MFTAGVQSTPKETRVWEVTFDKEKVQVQQDGTVKAQWTAKYRNSITNVVVTNRDIQSIFNSQFKHF